MGKKILYIQYTNPAAYPPLQHSSRILIEKGWEAVFLGTDSCSESNCLKLEHRPEISEKRVRYFKRGLRQKFHYLWFHALALALALKHRPEWAYLSDPLMAPLGLLLSYAMHIKVIYHEHDSPSELPRSRYLRFCMWSRRSLAKKAGICILPNSERVRMFIRNTGADKHIHCVWNCPLSAEVGPCKTHSGKEGLDLFYHGVIRPQGLPLSLIRALSILPPDVRFFAVGYETIGNRGYGKSLLDTARRCGVSDRVHIGGPLSRSSLMDECRKYDVGIAFSPRDTDDINLKYLDGASNKPFDYLSCALALLVSDLPSWRRIFVEPGYGMACDSDDPESIARAIGWFLAHPEDVMEMGERGRQRVLAEWNYEHQFEPVKNILCAPQGTT